MNHSKLLSLLNNCDHVSSVRLVGRTTLAFPCTRGYFILPDFHLMTKSVSGGFAYSFHHDKGWSDLGGTYREPLIRELLDTLPDAWDVLHLGDLYDAWREEKKPAAAADAIRAEYSWVKALRDRARLIVGNHDRFDAEVADPKMVASVVLESKVLVTHGDLFDPIETLPDVMNATAVLSKVGRLAGSREANLSHSVLAQVEQDIEPLTSHSHLLAPAIVESVEKLRSGDVQTCTNFGLKSQKHDIRVVVVGHTHHARVVWSSSGKLLIVDGGAWVGRCTMTPASPPEPSAQVVVIAPTSDGAGTDFRVYQLTVR